MGIAAYDTKNYKWAFLMPNGDKNSGNFYHFCMVYLWKGIDQMLSWKNECKISIFSFGQSDKVWINAEKAMIKSVLHCHPLDLK